MEKKCEECGDKFEAESVRAKFCSIACKSSFHRKVTVSDTVSESGIVSPSIVSESSFTVSEVDRIVSRERIVSEEVDDDVGTPAKVVDLVKDLHLDLEKDLGVTSWTADGIFIRPDIRVGQVQNIARLVAAKHGRPCPEFRQQGL